MQQHNPIEDQSSGTHSSRYADGYNDEIDLAKYLASLWRYWWVIALVTLACGLAAFFRSRMAPPIYEASARLAVSQSKVAEGFSGPPMLNLASYRALLDNQSLAVRVLQEFALDKPPYNLTVSSFLAGGVGSEVLRDTNVIAIKIRLRDPVMAANVANRYLQLAIEQAQRLSQEETVTARDMIKSQLDESVQRLNSAQTQLENFRRDAQVDLLRKDVETRLGQRGDLQKVLVEVEAEKGRLAAAQEQLSKKDRIETLNRSIDVDSALMEAVKQGSKPQDSPILPLQLHYEVVDLTYQTLDEMVAKSNALLSGLENQKNQLATGLKLGGPQLAELNRLYSKETALARMDTEYSLAQKIYLDVATRYEQARLLVASRTAQLQLLDPALAPDHPVSPVPLRAAAIGLVVGFVLSIPLVFFYDFIASSRHRTETSARRVSPLR